MGTVVETMIIEDAITTSDTEILDWGDLNYDADGFVLEFNNYGKIEYDILAVYMLQVSYDDRHGKYFKDYKIYLRVKDLPQQLRDSLIEEIV